MGKEKEKEKTELSLIYKAIALHHTNLFLP